MLPPVVTITAAVDGGKLARVFVCVNRFPFKNPRYQNVFAGAHLGKGSSRWLGEWRFWNYRPHWHGALLINRFLSRMGHWWSLEKCIMKMRFRMTLLSSVFSRTVSFAKHRYIASASYPCHGLLRSVTPQRIATANACSFVCECLCSDRLLWPSAYPVCIAPSLTPSPLFRSAFSSHQPLSMCDDGECMRLSCLCSS